MIFFAAFAVHIFSLIVTAQNGPLTQDFQYWLQANGYETDDFARKDLGSTGSFGGRLLPSDRPVIFIHGNSDGALHDGALGPGWSDSIQYFLNQGYTESELYATSWGDRNYLTSASRTHNCFTLRRLRRFVEAVLGYTCAPKVDIIGHSMGVTFGRRIIKGGLVAFDDESCDLGLPLADRVDTFLGITGGNFGFCICTGIAQSVPFCNGENGFWPGDSCGQNLLTCGVSRLPFPCDTPTYSTYLMQLNADTIREATYIFSIWSTLDDHNVWGRATSLIPCSNRYKIYNNCTHTQTKCGPTVIDQFNAVVNHVLV